jgi:Holliday junction resolvase RusA-like endonuclease
VTARLILRVPGLPIPQGSHVALMPRGRPGARPIVVADNKKLLDPWRKDVHRVARMHMLYREPFLGAVEVHYIFEMPRPQSVTTKMRPRPSVKPDLSKLIRAVEDSFTTAGVWGDDGQVVRIVADEYYAPSPAQVGVRVLVRDASLKLTPEW